MKVVICGYGEVRWSENQNVYVLYVALACCMSFSREKDLLRDQDLCL